MHGMGTGSFVLETERMVLRQMVWGDQPAISEMLQDPEVMYAWEHAFADVEVDEWIAKRIAEYAAYGNFGYWAVILKETSTLIGQCGLTMQDAGGRRVLEVGYIFNKKFWHKGYATEAARAAVSYAFHTLRADAVYSIIRENNGPSIRVAKRNGMRPVGCVVKRYRGIEMPHTVYCIKSSAYAVSTKNPRGFLP